MGCARISPFFIVSNRETLCLNQKSCLIHTPPTIFKGFEIIGLLDASCVLCGDAVTRSTSLCKPCQNDLPILGNTCNQCGIPLESSHETQICGQCLQQPPAVDYTLSLYHYEAPIDYLITQLKFQQQLPYAAILGYLLEKFVLKMNVLDLPDALLPVPLHSKRLVKRGFNQSLEISRPVANTMKLPILLNTVQRKRDTLMQVDLSAKERRKNVKNCFKLEKVPEYQHIVIIDDVVTTGSTINELAKLLKAAGVEKVGVWSIARANFIS